MAPVLFAAEIKLFITSAWRVHTLFQLHFSSVGRRWRARAPNGRHQRRRLAGQRTGVGGVCLCVRECVKCLLEAADARREHCATPRVPKETLLSAQAPGRAGWKANTRIVGAELRAAAAAQVQRCGAGQRAPVFGCAHSAARFAQLLLILTRIV